MNALGAMGVYVKDGAEFRKILATSASIKRTLNTAVASLDVVCRNEVTTLNMLPVELRESTTVLFSGTVRKHGIAYVAPEEDKIGLTGLDVLDLANNRLVAEAYPEDTVPYDVRTILLAILAKYFPEITTNHVEMFTSTITDYRIDYEPLFKVLKKLADMSGCYFYIDKDLDLHWFQDNEGSVVQTYDLSNILTNGWSVDFNSTDLVNRLWVIGAKQASAVEREQIFTYDGVNRIFNLGYEPNYVRAYEYSGGWIERTINLESNYDGDEYFLYNKQEKNVSIPVHRTVPASGQFKITYRPTIEIIDYFEDLSSQAQYGLYEQALKSRDIKTKAEARKIARTSLKTRRGNNVVVNFKTRDHLPLEIGKLVKINMPRYGLNNVSLLITDLTLDYALQNGACRASVVAQGVL